ncbi:hypothetical protein Brsp06_03292 [Brucella sp. NBRC 13694]|uniref:hypothetical protein n=1 Tax=Brucella sp. NBRC 13694 TaxID=3075482 RepID=UPI0030964B50
MGFWGVFFVSGVVFGGGCAIIAANKKRDPLGWFALGVLFSLVALIVIAALSPAERPARAASARARQRQTATDFVANPKDPERPWLG